LLDWKLTIDWPFFWRKWSTWLAGINASLWTYVTAHSGMLLGFVPFVSRSYQGFAAGVVFVLAFIVPVIAVHIKQPAVREASIERAITKVLPNA